jgi:hypothetical protein
MMTKMRNFDLYMLRYMPYALRDDFVTIGFVLIEEDCWFSDLRMTRDWRNLQCIDPDIDLERFELVETEIRTNLQNMRKKEDLAEFVCERFGTSMYVAPAKGIRAEDPLKEMELLSAQHLGALARSEGPPRARTGRKAIVYRMNEAFSAAGVLELLQTDLDMGKYIGREDPFRMDFGYRVSGVVKMFHAVSMATNVDQALALLCRYSEIEAGMRQEQLGASLTAVVDLGPALQEERGQFAVDKLRQHSIAVKTLRDMGEIANDVRVDLRM